MWNEKVSLFFEFSNYSNFSNYFEFQNLEKLETLIVPESGGKQPFPIIRKIRKFSGLRFSKFYNFSNYFELEILEKLENLEKLEKLIVPESGGKQPFPIIRKIRKIRQFSGLRFSKCSNFSN